MIENSTGARLAVLFTLVCLILPFSSPARAEEIKTGLKLVETKTGLVPELCWDDPRNWVMLPGTRIKAGSFRYLYGSHFNARHNIEEVDETCKAGILFDDALYYVESSDVGGDTHFGVYKDYLLMDSFAYGASHNRTMYLFRYDKGSAQLLDDVGVPIRANVGWLDFMSQSSTSYPDRRYSKFRGFMMDKKEDIDHDGNLEFDIRLQRNDLYHYYYDETTFNLFFEIKGNRLPLDLNPVLYRPLFDKEKDKAKGKGFKPDAYYIYGFLSGEFTLDKVKAVLKDELYVAEAKRYFIKKYDSEYDQYDGVVWLLERRDKWDELLGFDDDPKSPVWMDIKDIDLDGNPEVEIEILRGNYNVTTFDLFFEIKDERLRLDLNPVLYGPLFVKERKKAKGKGFKRDAYYIYGFLSGEFALDKVKAMLKDELYVAESRQFFMKKHDSEYDQYKSVVPLLESRDKWEYKYIKPKELIKYEIKRR
ncbi:MAG: hypothetical protein HY884_00755 [Deltaproteobacteria bacterium]|nr:hypothetical protein [Deltaproteobacteria bacterium]